MPYSTPTSPVASPVRETPHSRKGFYTPTIPDDDMFAGASALSGPMPGIPRRQSSNYTSGSNTPRHARSPPMSRQPSASQRTFPSSRPLEGLPRRLSDATSHSTLAGLPRDGEGTLGLRLHPSPTKAPQMQRGQKDSMSSTSTVESSLPATPRDEPHELGALHIDTEPNSIPFPASESSHKPLSAHHPLRSSMGSQSRPVLGRRSASGLGHRGAGTGSLQLQLPLSASTSRLTVSASDAPSRPTSMIRKKSGEVVKPSLKQRSMSTPDLTRQADKEQDSPEDDDHREFGEERSKSVRFADTDDPESGALENVVLFLREQKVTAVGKAADPDRAGAYTASETEDTDANDDFVHFRTRRNAAARLADEMSNIQLEGGSKVPRVRCDFSPDARGSLNGENVVLERVELQNQSGPLILKGTAIVRNIAFQKWVAVRFTLDHWQTTSEVTGTHVTHVPSATTGDEGWDRFSFSIKLDDYKRKLDERQLIMCIRFSIDGREWWDSNDGMNYNFGFSKAPPRRSRVSGPAALGGGFMRLEETATISGLPGLRQGRSSSPPSSSISKDFGADKSMPTGPRNWVFPRLAAQYADLPTSRPDSPALSPPPAAFYRPPPPPDAHTHLSLSKYCAPSPPQSPPNKEFPGFGYDQLKPAPSSSTDVQVIGGQLATLAPPVVSHERRSSWNGNSETWESFSQAMEGTSISSTEGDNTPVAAGSRSPDLSGESSPEHKPLQMKRSTGDLRALLIEDAGLVTPPSSNHSTPPSPNPALLPGEAMSPSPSSSASTGESSPINTISSDSTPDLASIHIDQHDLDPTLPPRRRSPNSHKMLSNSYQEFLDKFCFFQSPRVTPLEEPTYRQAYLPLSGHASPHGFPFYHGHPSNSPRGTPTPAAHRPYDAANDAFAFHATTNNVNHNQQQWGRPGVMATGEDPEAPREEDDNEHSFGTTPTTPKAIHKPTFVGANQSRNITPVPQMGYPDWGRMRGHDATPPPLATN